MVFFAVESALQKNYLKSYFVYLIPEYLRACIQFFKKLMIPFKDLIALLY